MFRIWRGQTVELAADMGRLRRRVGEGDRPIESNPSLVRAAELFQKCPTRAMKIEIAIKLLSQRLDHGEGGLRPAAHRDRHRAIKCDDWRRLHALECSIKEFYLVPIGVLEAPRAR